jgi:hypothetical protein
LRIVEVFIQEKAGCINTATILKPGYYSSNLTAYEDGTDRVFRNVGIHISEVGQLSRRKHTTFTTLRKFEIKNPSTCFGCLSHPTLGGHKTVVTTTGTSHVSR